MRSSDWSSDVCSSELADPVPSRKRLLKRLAERLRTADLGGELFSGGVEAADVIVAIVEIVAHLVPRQAHRVRALAADRVIQRLQPVKLVAIGAVHQIGRAHVCTPVTNAHLVCLLLLDKNTKALYM